jgi:phage shock protein A
MSKKAKRVVKAKRASRKPTALDHAKCMWNNTQALLDQAEAKIATMTADANKAAERIASLLLNGDARQRTIDSQRSSIAKLKAIVAGLEKDVARGEGTITALANQIDQAADKVMVQPPVMMSPQEARRLRGQPDRHYDGGAFDGLTRMATDTAAQPKHWSDL